MVILSLPYRDAASHYTVNELLGWARDLHFNINTLQLTIMPSGTCEIGAVFLVSTSFMVPSAPLKC